jgi:hypothetical protein
MPALEPGLEEHLSAVGGARPVLGDQPGAVFAPRQESMQMDCEPAE